MSEKMQILEVDKCIVLRLWYTGWVILRNEIKEQSLKNFSQDEISKLECLIKSNISSQTEWQDQWIAWNLLKDLGVENSGQVEKELKSIEFMAALKAISNNIPENVSKELLALFNSVSNSKNVKQKVAKITEESLMFLAKNLEECPVIVCYTVQKLLCVWSPCFADSDSDLQNLYCNVLKKILNKAEPEANKAEDTISLKSDFFRSCENVSWLCGDNTATLLSILSRLELTEFNKNKLLAWLYPTLLETCKSGYVELALYARQSNEYLKDWYRFMDEKLARCQAADNLENAHRISEAIFDFETDEIVPINSKELSTRVILRGTHWLNDILDICFTFTVHGYTEKVSAILSKPTLENLWPALLFKFLNECPDKPLISSSGIPQNPSEICNALRFLFDKCDFNTTNDETLKKLNATLGNHLAVTEWILKNRESHINQESEENDFAANKRIDKNFSVRHILGLLRSHTVLSVLHMSTEIHEREHDEIMSLLEDSAESTVIFRAYRAMLSALKAIILCESYNFQSEKVAKYISEMESTLGALFPLSLRLEMIKNIFSLLFLRHEDFNNGDSNSEGSEDEVSEAQLEKKIFRPENKEVQKYRTGFICNKYAVRELLHCLKNVVLAVGMERAKLKRDWELLNDSEKDDKNISLLNKALADAKWRLELLTSSEFTQRAGIDQADRKENAVSLDMSDKYLNDKFMTSPRLKNKSLFYKQEESSSDEEGKSEIDLSSETGSVGNNTSQTGRRRKQSRTSSSNSAPSTQHLPNQESPIINDMLASRESLVVQCLWKGDFGKAQQVIKIFQMKDSQLDGEVRFSKAMLEFRQEMKLRSGHSDMVDSYRKGQNYSMLQNIRQAVQEGMQTSRITGQLETFLASQKATVRILSPEEVDGNVTLTMAALDLALTTEMSQQNSANLCDVANKYLKSCKKLDNSVHSTYFSKIYQLMCEIKLDRPLPSILRDARVPLSVKAWRESNQFWTEVAQKFEAFKQSQHSVESHQKSRKDGSLPGQKSFTRIMALCNNGERYLQKVYAHLKLLGAIAPRAGEGISIANESLLLEHSLDSYFGRQIFQFNTEPEKLEAIASKLQVNLVHSVLVNCCPRLPYDDEIRSVDNKNEWGSIVLNEYIDNMKFSESSSLDPNKCVADILSSLLQIVSDSILTKSTSKLMDIENSSKQPAVQNILAETCRFAALDLSGLSVGNETLTFFLNMWNLLFLHSVLTIWAKDAPYNCLRHTVSLMTIGYKIGQLGLVTLASLRAKLLGNLAWNLEFFEQIDQLNEPAWQDLDLTQDPRVIFAMANEFCGTPAIRVFNSETLDDDLNTAMHDYFLHFPMVKSQTDSVKNPDEPTVYWLPELVQRYHKVVSRNSKPGDLTPDVNTNEYQRRLDKYLILPEDNAMLKYHPRVYRYEIKVSRAENNPISDDPKNIQSNSENTDDSVWLTRKVDPNLLQYLEGHCWLLSYLVQRIHKESPTTCDDLRRISCLENLLNSPWVDTLKDLFDGNTALAGMQENLSNHKLWLYFEASLRNNQWQQCLAILNSLPDNLLRGNSEIQCLRDKVLDHLVSERNGLSSSEILEYVQQIQNVQVLVQTILANVKNWSAEVCEGALNHALQHTEKDKLPFHCKLQMNEILCRVTAFRRMLPYCTSNADSGKTTWYDIAYCTEQTDPLEVVKSLIDANKFELCLEWLEYHAFSSEMQSLVTQDLLFSLLENDRQDFKCALKLLQALPINQSVKMSKGVLRKLGSIRALRFIVGYLLDHCKLTETIKYQKTSVGVEILARLEPRERTTFVHLIKEPLLMLEQLLMYGKFENLQKILNSIKDNLPRAEIRLEDFDKIVRYYAGKSLDFRVVLQSDSNENKLRGVLMSGADAESTEFIMPLNVPTKDEWVPNDKARECSCCKAVVFSMFNRRHHCRRCGRVVCAVCSQHRMRVSSYPDSVLVRVCEDCKCQTALQTQLSQGTPSTPSSDIFDCWRLTTDQTHNQSVRDEFSFEHAPSISLCLVILNLHSDHEAYYSFLLDRCDEMKRLLQPVAGGRANPEVDHVLIIKMIRSLLVAAKVKCAKLGHNAGLTHCDRFLSQVDLLTTLVKSDCSVLIPSDDLKDHALCQLRNLLIKREQWTLALDVSTKSGLERQGVWAAWGKACMKVGRFDQAREKLAHCLEKVDIVDADNSDGWILLSGPRKTGTPPRRSMSESSKSKDSGKLLSISESPKTEEKKKRRETNRPAKNPPLLVEILQILEGLNVRKQSVRSPPTAKSSPAQEVLNTLGVSRTRNVPDAALNKTVNYQESLYYLLTYGSHSSILEFLTKHGDLEAALIYTLENDIDADLFFSGLYQPCLQNGKVDQLHECMRAKDSSLLPWKSYLVYTCHNLEQTQFLNTLYQLQIFMKDYVRACMTCIRFYTSEATSYTDLCSRSHLLNDAQKHLETELQVQNFGKRRRKSVSSSHSGHSGLTMEMEPSEIDRHVNTISRQMEVTKFLSNGEKEGRDARKLLHSLSSMESDGSLSRELPTLFGTQMQKTQLAVLAILCGRDVEEGFGIAFRIIQDYNIRSEKVYSLAGHVLALEGKISSVEQLVKCCRSSGAQGSSALSDRVLAHCVKLLLNKSGPESSSRDQVDTLIRMITDIELKISSYVESRQLKAAYLLAVKYSRAQDVRRILREADRLGQKPIKTICTKWLQQAHKS